jgi:DNA-binding transcriptional LysR family regulator
MTESPKNPQFYYKNNRFQQLRGFYFAAKLGNLTKAAEVMNLTQPSISLQIKALESDLNTILFERKGPTIALTKDGATLLELVQPLVENIDNLKENFLLLTDQQDKGKLNIAANQATILYLLPKVVRNYTKKYPDMKIKIHGAVGMSGIEKLRSGEVDIIVGPPSFDIPDDFVYQPVFYYDPVLITRPDHPLAGKKNITIEEMSRYQLILPPAHLRTIKTMDDVFSHHNFERADVKLEFEGWEIIKRYVEMDLAITIALSIAIEDDPVLVGTNLNHYFPRSSYGFILRRGQISSQKVKDFISILKANSSKKQ